MIVVEHDKRQPARPRPPAICKLVDRRFYGDTGVSFYRRATGLA